ncbi:hypothetical protein ACQ4PT_024705 [Festuca glaucescens]
MADCKRLTDSRVVWPGDDGWWRDSIFAWGDRTASGRRTRWRLVVHSGSICFAVATHYRKNGLYLAKLAYEMQYLGYTYSPMYKMVWKVWAPLKAKFVAWLIT